LIFAPQVRVINEEGQQIGILPVKEALSLAESQGLDLVEIAPQAKPPVCKIIDYGKYMYELKKEQQRAKKKQIVIKLHEIKFGIMTDDHDMDHKMRKIQEFLSEGDKVKLTVMFRGRELEHKELGKIVLDKVVEKLKDIAVIEQLPKQEGRALFTVVGPQKVVAVKRKSA